MASIATNVQWGSSPKIYFDFSYEKKRDGSTQYYQIKVSCRSVSGTSYFGYPIYVAISLDGTSKTSYTLKNASPSQWGSALTNTTGWLAVSNKTSGTTALSIRIYSGSGSTRNTTYSYNLAIDPAASTITCTKTNIESNPTIVIDRASSNFTHTIKYRFGTLEGTVVERTSATRITDWTIPADFYTQIPSAKEGYGGLYCTTYDGNGNELGTNRCDLVATTDEAKCKPSIMCSAQDINPRTTLLTGDPNILVRYVSTARCVLLGTPKNSASITQRLINNTPTAANSTIEIANVETGTFDFYVKDSRGYFNNDKYVCDFIPYIVLTCDATAYRNDPTSGNATLKIEGNYFDGSFGAFGNELTVKYKQEGVKEVLVTPSIKDNRYSVTVPLSGLNYTKVYKFTVTVADHVSSVSRELTIQKGVPVFDWGEEDFNFNVPVTINGVNILEKLAELEKLVKG